jgi:aminoglycoside phosphotransferase (APT) family kinase protein
VDENHRDNGAVDKSDITASLASRLVAEQFPQWRELPIEPVEHDGWDNATFRLGDEMLVRLPSADHYGAQVSKEQRLLPFLATQVPLPVPEPLAIGAPGWGYPRALSIYRWLEGEPATVERVADLRALADDLADLLGALYRIDPAGGPPAGEYNFFRGGPLVTYDG